MRQTIKAFLIIDLVIVLLTFSVWLPHLLGLNSFFGLDFSSGFNTIYRNFDGLEYVIIAKTLYDPSQIAKLPQSLPAIYYASHFPLYSLAILVFSPLLGFLKSMLFVSFLFTLFAAKAFYLLVRDFKLTNHPLLLSIIFLILPARWLVVHSVGSSEPVFIFFIISAFYFFMKFEQSNRWVWIHLAVIAGLFAQLTRPPGILLFIAFSAYIIWKSLIDKNNRSANFVKGLLQIVYRYHPLILIPLSLLGIFYYFSFTYNDFFAYFHSGDNIHLTFPPFQVFNKHQFWVGDIWLEDIIYIFLLGLGGGIYLLKQKLYPLAFFVLTYMVASIFVAHRDIGRYTIPAFPFILIAFEKFLTSREFRIVLIILALGIYLYTQNFLIENIGPYPNLEAFN